MKHKLKDFRDEVENKGVFPCASHSACANESPGIASCKHRIYRFAIYAENGNPDKREFNEEHEQGRL